MKSGLGSGSRRPRRWPIIASVKAICLLSMSICSLSLCLSATASAGTVRATPSVPQPGVPCLPPPEPLETGLQPAAGVSYADFNNCGGFFIVTTSEGVTGNTGSSDLLPERLNAPIVGIASYDNSPGYWLAGADGGVFAMGGVGFFGSAATMHLNAPIVGIAATPDGQGYYLVGADGGVFAFGDATFQGSMGGKALHAPIVGISTDPLTGGYRLVAGDGGVFGFGAPFLGSMAGTTLAQPIVGIATDVFTGGYWLAASDGGVFAFGSPFYGSWVAVSSGPIVGIASLRDDRYFLLDRSGNVAECMSPCGT
jgi:hypothetical protein